MRAIDTITRLAHLRCELQPQIKCISIIERGYLDHKGRSLFWSASTLTGLERSRPIVEILMPTFQQMFNLAAALFNLMGCYSIGRLRV